MECPAWLWNLIEKHAKKMDNVCDYSEWYKSIFYYKDDRFDLPKKDPKVVKTYEDAKQIMDAKKYNKIKKDMEDKKIDISIEEMPWKIVELQNQIEELKNLPPVEIEKIVTDHDVDIYPASDPRSKFHNDWKKSKIQKK